MKKTRRVQRKKGKISGNTKSIWVGIIFIVLILGAVITGIQTSFYGVAIGILIGFLSSNVINKINN